MSEQVRMNWNSKRRKWCCRKRLSLGYGSGGRLQTRWIEVDRKVALLTEAEFLSLKTTVYVRGTLAIYGPEVPSRGWTMVQLDAFGMFRDMNDSDLFVLSAEWAKPLDENGMFLVAGTQKWFNERTKMIETVPDFPV